MLGKCGCLLKSESEPKSELSRSTGSSNDNEDGQLQINEAQIKQTPLMGTIRISLGLLNQCSSWKSENRIGQAVTYSEEIVNRARPIFSEGVKELRLVFEDTGDYKPDIGTVIISLLKELVKIIPADSRLRIGIQNLPCILDNMEEIVCILSHPRVYSFLHVPRNARNNKTLFETKTGQNWTEDCQKVIDILKKRIPLVKIAPDISCILTEPDDAAQKTLSFCEKNKLNILFINQYYSGADIPAIELNRMDPEVRSRRTQLLTDLFNSCTSFESRMGKVYDILVTDTTPDMQFFVGHNKFYEQVLVNKIPSLMGRLVTVQITGICKQSMIGSVVEDRRKALSQTLTKLSVYCLLISILSFVIIKVY